MRDYIVVLGGRDWHVIYYETKHIKADSIADAEAQALTGQGDWVEVCAVVEIANGDIQVHDYQPESG